MEAVVILIAAVALAAVGYIFFSASRETTEKKRQETETSELRQQVTSTNVKLQKLEFEHATLQKDAEDAKIALEDSKSELETLRKKEFILNEETARLKEKERKQENNIELLKAENITLKEKLMDKENEAKKIAQEIKALRDQIDQLQSQDETSLIPPQKQDNLPPDNTKKAPSD